MSRNASEVSSRSLPITQREGGRSNRNTSAEIKTSSSSSSSTSTSTSSRSNPNLNPLIEQPSRPKPISAFGTSPDAATAAAVPGKRSAMMRSMRRLNASTRSSISDVDGSGSGGSKGTAIPARTRHSIGAISSSSSGSGAIRLAHLKRSQVAGTGGGRKSLLARDSRNASMPNIYHDGEADITRPPTSRRASADAGTRARPTSGSSEEQREERRIWDEMERRRLERQRIRDHEKDDERRLSNQMQKYDSKRSLGSATSSSGRDSSLSNSSFLTAQQRNHVQQEQSFRSLGTNVTSDSHVSQSSIISEQDVIANEFAQLRRMSIRESICSSDNISANNPGSNSQKKQQQQRSRSLLVGAMTAVEQTNYIDEDARLAAELQAQFDRENEACTHDGGHRIETTELYDGTTLRVIERQNHDGPMAANNSAANRRVICAGCRGRFRVSEGCELLMCPNCDTLTPV